MNKKEFIVDKQCKLSKAIMNNLPYFSYSRAMSTITKKDVKINDIRTSKDILLNIGDKVAVYYQDQNNDKKHYELVYTDENIVVVNKYGGIETINDKGDSLYHELCRDFGEIYAIHRLDLNTSGLVLFARNKTAEKKLLDDFRYRRITKKYQALVHGKPPKQKDIGIAYLVKDSKNSLVKIYDKEVAKSVKIVTEYQVVQVIGKKTLLNITLHTGKTHQIHAYMAHLGCAVVGDGKYGIAKRGEDLKLCAVSLTLSDGRTFEINNNF